MELAWGWIISRWFRIYVNRKVKQTNKQTHTHTHTQTSFANTHTHTNTQTHKHTHKHTNTHKHTHKHAHTHTHKHTNTHTQTHKHTTQHTHTHTLYSGIQILPNDKPLSEKWGQYRKSREKLFSLINNSKSKRILLMSGDVHNGEIFETHELLNRFILPEITASGLTHSISEQMPFVHFVVGKILRSHFRVENYYYVDRNYGIIEM